MKVLVTGGVRSGKSFHAESLLLGAKAVTYVAPGPTIDEDPDPDWASRIATHLARRSENWTTVETRDLARAIAEGEGALLIDCLGTWLTCQIDELDGWNLTRDEWEPVLFDRLDAVVDALCSTSRTVVLVTNEVGLGVIPEHRSGRVFRDLLGTVNQRLAAECDEVHLVVAGRVLTI